MMTMITIFKVNNEVDAFPQLPGRQGWDCFAVKVNQRHYVDFYLSNGKKRDDGKRVEIAARNRNHS